jgi:Zn-dependent protease with chaperone function
MWGSVDDASPPDLYCCQMRSTAAPGGHRAGIGGTIRTAREVRAARRLVRQALDRGPRNSLILGGPEVMFAVAGMAHPRVLVSAGALTALDDNELAAGLDHEQAHIAHRHRFVMLLALGCRWRASSARPPASPRSRAR